MNPHDEILAALDGLANRAPDPDRIRRTLNGRIRTHRQRRALLTAGAVAAGTAAAGVPAFLWLRSPGRHAPDGNLPAGNLPRPPAEPKPGNGNLRAPMILRPTWLPEGIVEVSRGAQIGGSPFQSRLWATPTIMAAIQAGDQNAISLGTSIDLNVSKAEPNRPASTAWPPGSSPPAETPNPLGVEPNTSIGPYPGYIDFVEGPTPSDVSVVKAANVSWLIEGGLLARLEVTGVPDAAHVALRIARSVVRDGTAGVEEAMRFGWLPDEFAPTPVTLGVTGLPGRWTQLIQVSDAAMTSSNARATLESRSPAPLQGAKHVTVRGRAGLAAAGEVRVQLADGHWLTVFMTPTGDPTADQIAMLRIAKELIIGPDPYLGWIGTR